MMITERFVCLALKNKAQDKTEKKRKVVNSLFVECQLANSNNAKKEVLKNMEDKGRITNKNKQRVDTFFP